MHSVSEVKLTKAQLSALDWMWSDGSARQWMNVPGDPAINTLRSLVRHSFAYRVHRPGEYFGRSELGRRAIASSKAETP